LILAAAGTFVSGAVLAERPAEKVVGRTSTGAPIKEYQISYGVRFADLDITTPVGAQALKARVRLAAIALCKDLDALYPMAEQDPSCATKSEEGAMAEVNAAIKMAQGQGKSTAR
jgi:UrcA family protein